MNLSNIKNKLLTAREEKYLNILKTSKKNNYTILEISINIPFFPKNSQIVEKSLKLSLQIVISLFYKKIKSINYYTNFSGNYLLIGIDIDPYILKKQLIKYEEKFRIIDFDIYYKGEKLSSYKLNLKEKTCFVCGQPISICRTKMKHTKKEIYKAFLNIYNKLKNHNKNNLFH